MQILTENNEDKVALGISMNKNIHFLMFHFQRKRKMVKRLQFRLSPSVPGKRDIVDSIYRETPGWASTDLNRVLRRHCISEKHKLTTW